MLKKTLNLLLFLFLIISLTAQEYLVGIGNPMLRNYSKIYWSKDKNNNFKADTIELELPFFDDFAASYMYPDSTKWTDKFAFIGHNYAINPVTINTATLDAINQYGKIYPHLPYDNHEVADYLTSQPINLQYDAADSIYLSFFFQAGGFGNEPEYRDSLVLEFRTPDIDWKSVWRIPGGEKMDYFQVVMIPITDSAWLTNGFQFRFKNYVSLTSLYEPAFASNVDHWHLDFIKLDKNRNIADSMPNDVGFVKNIKSMIHNFEAVPWKHYQSIEYDEMVNDTIIFYYKNWRNEILSINRQFEVIDLLGNDHGYSVLEDFENINPLETIIYERPFNYIFTSDSEDSASFEIKIYIDSGTDEEHKYRWNDTIRYYQNFFNYYAYDDGSAELGYGIGGQGSAQSKLALRFDPLKADSLQGIYMFFNHTLNEANQNYFYLTIWDDNDGVPGDTIYQEIGVLPQFSEEINGFVFYPLDTAVFVQNTFYVGWVKTTDHILNIGFDINRVANQHLFYNVTGEWQQSSMKGAAMIRPVFANENPYSYAEQIKDKNKKTEKYNVELFPNPANNLINISVKENTFPQFIEIFDINARLLIKQKYSETIDISAFEQGVYLLRITSEIDVFETKRFFIKR